MYDCGEVIEPEKLRPYREGHQVSHRHERGLAGWKPPHLRDNKS